MKYMLPNIKNSAVIFALIVSLFSLPSISYATIISAVPSSYPSYIANSGEPDWIIDSITKKIGIKRNDGVVLNPNGDNIILSDKPDQRELNMIDENVKLSYRRTYTPSPTVNIFGIFSQPQIKNLYVVGVDNNPSTDDIKRIITSSNPNVISCPNSSQCSVVGNGYVEITFAFKKEGGAVSTTFADEEERNRVFRYSMPSTTYRITVKTSQQPPSVSYQGTRDIGYNNATSDWTYSDPNGDRQSVVTVQYFTDEIRTVMGAQTTIDASIGNVADWRALAVSGLRAGTTYWPKVLIRNTANETAFADGPAFTTLAFPTPTLDFNVRDINGGSAIAGETLEATWTVTNTEGIDRCTAFTTGQPNIATGIWNGRKTVGANQRQNIILPRSQVQKTYNFRMRCDPKPGGTGLDITRVITVDGTPATLNFRLNDIGERGNDDLRQGDNLEFAWETTNPQVITTCEGSTVGTPDTLFSGNKNKNRGTSTARVPDDIRVERDYIFRLTCNVVDGNPITRTIAAKVKPKPPISCSLINRVVSESNKNVVVDFDTDPTWTGPYRWILKRGLGNDIVFENSNNDNRQTLDYTDIVNQGLGRYELKAQLSTGGILSDEVVCGIVNSLGNRTIREISP